LVGECAPATHVVKSELAQPRGAILVDKAGATFLSGLEGLFASIGQVVVAVTKALFANGAALALDAIGGSVEVHTVNVAGAAMLERVQEVEVLVNLPVTVIVDQVALFRRVAFIRVTDLLLSVQAVYRGLLALPEAAGGFAQVLIDDVVAVIVQAVAKVLRASLKRVAFLGCSPQAVLHGVKAFTNAAGGSAKPLINVLVTVFIHTVAGFNGPWEDHRVEGLTVEEIGRTITIVVVVSGVAYTVLIQVLLLGVCKVQAIVLGVEHAVSVVILVYAVRLPVLVLVLEAFVDLTVAVIVGPVALLFLGPEERVALLLHTLNAHLDRILARSQAAGLIA